MKNLLHDDFDIEKYRGMEPLQMMLAMRRDLEFKMPPRGVSVTTARFAGYVWKRMTWRCEVEGCWYITTPSSDENLKSLQEYHLKPGTDQCPTSPRRERLPSGKMEIDKLWAEMDDVVDALKDKTAYRDMTPDELKGYAKGLAFSIVMKETEFFQDIRSVTIEAMKRWKRRKGILPWEATPSHDNYQHRFFPGGGWKPVKRDDTSVSPNVRVNSGRKPAQAARPAKVWTEQQRAAIKAAHTSGLFSPEDLAGSYECTAAEINRVLAG